MSANLFRRFNIVREKRALKRNTPPKKINFCTQVGSIVRVGTEVVLRDKVAHYYEKEEVSHADDKETLK
jgi:hypothetical protein